MLRLSKVLLLTLLAVSMIASFAFATTSRVTALAGAAPYINDDSDIFRWYGTLPSYTKMVMAEAGTGVWLGTVGGAGFPQLSNSYQALGFTHNWGEDHWLGTWGIFLMMNSVEDMSFYAFNPLIVTGSGENLDALGVSTPTTKFVLSWGNEIDMFSYGFNFTRSDVSIETPTTGKNDMNLTTIGGGVRVDLGEDAYGDLALTFGFSGGDTLGGFDKGNTLDLAGRLFYEWMDDVTVVPYVDYRKSEFSFENPTAPHGDNVSDVTLGVSLNFDVNTNNMLIFATEIGFFNWEYSKSGSPADQSEVKVNTLPKFYVALESEVNSWFTARVGATKQMQKITEKDATGEETIVTDPAQVPFGSKLGSFEDFEWFLGGGFHIGEWDIDAVFSHELPFRLGYWLTGYGVGEVDPPIGRISGTYRF